jgi:hypothetical protein
MEKALAEGWKFDFCPSCGFFIITMPTGKHYCPKCR